MDLLKKESDEKLYHYTTINSLNGIISNKELWFGNVLHMNDTTEMFFFVDEIKERLIKKVPKAKNEIELYFKDVYKRIKDEQHYSLCLTTLRDDASLWERYADYAAGVCIVFNKEKYKDFIKNAGCFALNEVFYDLDVENHAHYNILKKYFESGELKEFNNIKGQRDNFIACSSLHKHRSFSLEKEIRNVTLLPINYYKKEFCKIEFENKDSCIKEFLKIKYDKVCEEKNTTYSDLFDEIIIGPRSSQSKRILKDFCIKNGFDNIKVTRSKCPLR